MDEDRYQPAPHVLDHIKGIILVAVVGPTASGKTTLIKKAAAKEPELIHMVLTNTSRPMREGEKDGQEYHFHSKSDMQDRVEKGEYVQELPSLFGELYATAPEDYKPGKINLMLVLAQAVPDIKALPFKEVRAIFVVPPDMDSWQQRIHTHQLGGQQLPSRLAEARHSLEFLLDNPDVPLVITDDPQTALDDFIILALGRDLPQRLQADQTRGRQIAQEILNRL